MFIFGQNISFIQNIDGIFGSIIKISMTSIALFKICKKNALM